MNSMYSLILVQIEGIYWTLLEDMMLPSHNGNGGKTQMAAKCWLWSELENETLWLIAEEFVQ